MSLNLGLENLGIVTDADSYEAILETESEFNDAYMSFERAAFRLATDTRNIQNYNEIIDSLKRHASQECVDFASDLLGTRVSLEAEKIPLSKDPLDFGGKIGAAWNWFVEFVKKCYNWCSTKIKQGLTKIHVLAEHGGKGTIKVHYKLQQLKEFNAKTQPIAKSSTSIERNPGVLNDVLNLQFLTEKAQKDTIDLGNGTATADYFNELNEAQKNLFHLVRHVSSDIKGKAFSAGSAAGTKKVTDANKDFIKWTAAMMKRLKPFQKGIVKDVNAFMKRAFKGAWGDVKSVVKTAKKGADDADIQEKKMPEWLRS